MFQLGRCLCRVRKLSDFINNIFICVPKMNEGLTGLENVFIFGWTIPLKHTDNTNIHTTDSQY